MKKQLVITLILGLALSFQAALAESVYKRTVARAMQSVYQQVSEAMEAERFWVVFEPSIWQNMAGFRERWGEQYNRSGLTDIRSMVICNIWYVNQVANLDPDMLGLCPLRIGLYEKDGHTTVLFARPTVMAADSPALVVIQELENRIIAALEQALP